MKKQVYIYLLAALTVISVISCAASNKPTDIAKSEEVAKLVNQDSYTFIATRAYPIPVNHQ